MSAVHSVPRELGEGSVGTEPTARATTYDQENAGERGRQRSYVGLPVRFS